ncbi:pilus assembly protein PilS [Candidatus Williamhamiltonella defendens]|uniref:Pilus assembly protein PilS n=1 Tax=Candidatus Williamhamiltonella defendens TaxID=138072 RepID=A0AAC9VL82_9ENTR|nr:type 4 pilus major pilin [Candidatus Hamiltonella defensa]ASV33910.1 pilus assembly protein PilS [Candidatus Hamiltonella defensa]AWK16867.1 pilus assembly protein PilS [Candidatus Hamiltonella defensa]
MKSLKQGIFNISDASIGWGMAFVGLAMVAAAGMGLYVKVYSTSSVASINTLLNETKSLRISTGYGTANLVPALIRSGAIPKGISIVGDRLFNASGGAITVTGSGIGFMVSTAGMNEKDCMKLATTLSNGDIASVRINSAPAMTGEISPAQASAACVAGRNNTVTFTTHM